MIDDSTAPKERAQAMSAWAKAVLAAREAIPFEAFGELTEDDGRLLEAVERLALRADVGTLAPSKVAATTNKATETSEEEEKPHATDPQSPIVAHLRARQERLRKAAETTDRLPWESYVVAWLRHPSEEKSELRNRFPHRLADISTRTLERISGLVRDVARAITENDRDALEHAERLAVDWFGLGSKTSRICTAYDLLETAVRHKGAGMDAEQITMLLLALSTCDPRLGRLDRTVALEIVSRVDTESSGGRDNLGVVGGLAELAVAAEAFDARELEAMKKEIKKYRSRSRKAK